jgi:hypothetical protein
MDSLSIRDIPRECIEDCSHSGSCDYDVAMWLQREPVKTLIEALDSDAMRCALKGYGAWEPDELADDDANRARILWLACVDFSEYILHCEIEGIDPFAETVPEDFHPSSGSDIFVLE